MPEMAGAADNGQPVRAPKEDTAREIVPFKFRFGKDALEVDEYDFTPRPVLEDDADPKDVKSAREYAGSAISQSKSAHPSTQSASAEEDNGQPKVSEPGQPPSLTKAPKTGKPAQPASA